MAALSVVLVILFILICVLIIGIVLMQDPKGGGLAGVLGGAGASSAFGAKTADVVMKVTIGLGIVFFALSLLLGYYYRVEKVTTGPLPAQPLLPPIEATPVPGAAAAPAGVPAQPAPGAPAQAAPAGGASTTPSQPAPAQGTSGAAQEPAATPPGTAK